MSRVLPERDRLLAVRQELAGGGQQVVEIGPGIEGLIRSWQCGQFGCSLRAFLLYAQWGDWDRRQAGVVIAGADVLFGVGLYHRPDGWHLHVVGPQGGERVRRVADFSRRLLAAGLVDRVYVRHLVDGAEREFLGAGFIGVERYPWMPESPAEDETYPHRLVDLTQALQPPFGPRTLRLAHHRFSNFLRRCGATCVLRPLGHFYPALEIAREHFLRQGKPLTALDYELLIRTALPDGERYLSQVAWLKSDRTELPVGVFLGEQIGPTSGALYLNVAVRNPALVESLQIRDRTGFSAIAAYLHAELFRQLASRGWQTVDLGGSETASLDRFKQTIGAQPLLSRWVVLTREEMTR